jgi:Ser/Thr protein kinase RdoA (MazF antagonist)
MQKSSIQAIAKTFRIRGANLNLVSGGQVSYVFEYRSDKRPLILRLTKNAGNRYELACAETDFVNYLADNGVKTARPVRSRSGTLTELLELSEGRFVVTAFERAEGEPVSLGAWSRDIWDALGNELGLIHRVTKDYKPPPGVRRPHWHEAEIMNVDRFLPKDNVVLRDKAQELIATLKTLPTDNDCYGLIHSDPNRGNIFTMDGKITLFDFEDCEYHWFANDLAIALYFAVEDSFNGHDLKSYTGDFMRALIKGYRRQNRIDGFWFGQIPVFHKLRDLLTVLYFYADGGNSLGEHEIARAVRSRMNLECDRSYLPMELMKRLVEMGV